ncbi:hypothetical protein Emag_006036 [Eimeria magna]
MEDYQNVCVPSAVVAAKAICFGSRLLCLRSQKMISSQRQAKYSNMLTDRDCTQRYKEQASDKRDSLVNGDNEDLFGDASAQRTRGAAGASSGPPAAPRPLLKPARGVVLASVPPTRELLQRLARVGVQFDHLIHITSNARDIEDAEAAGATQFAFRDSEIIFEDESERPEVDGPQHELEKEADESVILDIDEEPAKIEASLTDLLKHYKIRQLVDPFIVKPDEPDRVKAPPKLEEIYARVERITSFDVAPEGDDWEAAAETFPFLPPLPLVLYGSLGSQADERVMQLSSLYGVPAVDLRAAFPTALLKQLRLHLRRVRRAALEAAIAEMNEEAILPSEAEDEDLADHLLSLSSGEFLKSPVDTLKQSWACLQEATQQGLCQEALRTLLHPMMGPAFIREKCRHMERETDQKDTVEAVADEREEAVDGRNEESDDPHAACERARDEFVKSKSVQDAILLRSAKSFAAAGVPVLTVRSELCEGTLMAAIKHFLDRFMNYRKSLLLSPQCIPLSKPVCQRLLRTRAAKLSKYELCSPMDVDSPRKKHSTNFPVLFRDRIYFPGDSEKARQEFCRRPSKYLTGLVPPPRQYVPACVFLGPLNSNRSQQLLELLQAGIKEAMDLAAEHAKEHGDGGYSSHAAEESSEAVAPSISPPPPSALPSKPRSLLDGEPSLLDPVSGALSLEDTLASPSLSANSKPVVPPLQLSELRRSAATDLQEKDSTPTVSSKDGASAASQRVNTSSSADPEVTEQQLVEKSSQASEASEAKPSAHLEQRASLIDAVFVFQQEKEDVYSVEQRLLLEKHTQKTARSPTSARLRYPYGDERDILIHSDLAEGRRMRQDAAMRQHAELFGSAGALIVEVPAGGSEWLQFDVAQEIIEVAFEATRLSCCSEQHLEASRGTAPSFADLMDRNHAYMPFVLCICVVSTGKLLKGSLDLLVTYGGQTYAFASEEALQRFMLHPAGYTSHAQLPERIREIERLCLCQSQCTLASIAHETHARCMQADNDSGLSLDPVMAEEGLAELRDRLKDALDYIEISTVDLLIEGLLFAGKRRLLHPQLNPTASTVQLVAHFLNANNPLVSGHAKANAEEALNNFVGDCETPFEARKAIVHRYYNASQGDLAKLFEEQQDAFKIADWAELQKQEWTYFSQLQYEKVTERLDQLIRA